MSDRSDPADRPTPEHTRPDGLDDVTVEALGKLAEALEWVEVARGHLYAFHKLCGTADLQLQEAVDRLRDGGHAALADDLATELVGRNVLEGRWSFQVVEEYDDTYWSTFRAFEQRARAELAGGRRHLLEAEMKESERTRGRPAHRATPDDDSEQA